MTSLRLVRPRPLPSHPLPRRRQRAKALRPARAQALPTGTGESWIRKYCADSLPIHAAKTALFSAFNRRHGDLREELGHLGEIWTNCMLRLSPSAISKLQRIAQTQDRMLARVYQRHLAPV